MSSLEDKLLELKELLEKGMKNSGLGGVGSVKAGAVLPSISKMPKPGNASQAGKVGIPGQASTTKKSPIKSAEQTQNKDIKDIKMKEAHAELAMKKNDNEEITFAKNGQWSLESLDKSETPPEFDGHYHGQTHTKTTERGHRVVRFPGKDPHTGEATTYAKKVPNKVHITHRWDNNEKKWEHLHTKDHLQQEAPKHIKTTDEHASEKAKAYEADKNKPTAEVKPKTIRRSADIKKSLDELVDGLEKSGYKGYTPEDNARRKANNTGETTGIHTMNSIKAYGGSGPSAADREAKEMRAKSKKNPVKVYSQEEIDEMNKEESRPFYDYKGPKDAAKSHIKDAKQHIANKDYASAKKALSWAREAVERRQPVKAEKPKEIPGEPTKTIEMDKTEGRTTAAPGVSEMGIEVRRSNPKDTSYSKVVSPAKHGETAKEIARANIKQTSEIKPKLPK